MPPRSAQGQNLDPLLDTMANVVGILVMLVAVTQLSLSDAVERIRERGAALPVEAWMVEQAESESEQVEDALVDARERLAAMPPTERRFGMLLEEARPALEELEALPGREALAGLGAEALRDRIERSARQVELLGVAISDADRRLLRLNDILSELPAEQRPKVARLPDPRPPPQGYAEAAFFCRYGRVQAVDVEYLKSVLHIGIRDALGRDRVPTREDHPWLVNLFNKGNIGQGNLYWSFRSWETRRSFVYLSWRDQTSGESTADLRIGDSDFEAALRELDRQGHYLRFYVWTDSFDTYLEARYIAESAGFYVGWLPVDPKDELGVDLRGGRHPPTLID